MSQSIDFEYNGGSFPCDLLDVDFAETVTRKIEDFKQQERKLPVDGDIFAMRRSRVELYKRFFDEIFGEGAGDVICGSGCNERTALAGYEAWLDFIDAQSAEQTKERERFNKKIAAYSPNRAQRRAATKTAKK